VITAASRNDIIGKLTITVDSVCITKGWPATNPPRIRHFYLFLEQGDALPLKLERKYPAVSSTGRSGSRQTGVQRPTAGGS
jgi:hypothetical protein